LAEICEPETGPKSGHYLVPQEADAHSHLGPEDLEYLSAKGVFTLPDPAVCDELVEKYFHFVHHFFPVIEADSFLTLYGSEKRTSLSLHLLWSVFMAAASVSRQLRPD
jgi:hypothetical protein